MGGTRPTKQKKADAVKFMNAVKGVGARIKTAAKYAEFHLKRGKIGK